VERARAEDQSESESGEWYSARTEAEERET